MSNHEVMKEFDKAELISIAEELDINVTDDMSAVKIVEAIRESLHDEGVPEAEDCSDLLDDFLFVAGYIDEEGELIDDSPEGGELGNVVEAERVKSDTIKLTHTESGDGIVVTGDKFIVDGKELKTPPCYGFADDRDPSCRRCRIKSYCEKKRISLRPPCYGKLYSATDENCADCLEASTCKIVTLENIKVKEISKNGR